MKALLALLLLCTAAHADTVRIDTPQETRSYYCGHITYDHNALTGVCDDMQSTSPQAAHSPSPFNAPVRLQWEGYYPLTVKHGCRLRDIELSTPWPGAFTRLAYYVTCKSLDMAIIFGDGFGE